MFIGDYVYVKGYGAPNILENELLLEVVKRYWPAKSDFLLVSRPLS